MYLFLALSPFFVFNVHAYQQDNIPPTYTWTSPENFSVLTTDSIRLCVDAKDNENGSGINRVVFYAGYSEPTGINKKKIIIGEVTDFPYEILWDCSRISDQRIGVLSFFCDVIDNAGNVSSIANIAKDKDSKIVPLVVLDRNPELKDIQLLSHRINGDIVIDGNLNEWAKKDSIK